MPIQKFIGLGMEMKKIISMANWMTINGKCFTPEIPGNVNSIGKTG